MKCVEGFFADRGFYTKSLNPYPRYTRLNKPLFVFRLGPWRMRVAYGWGWPGRLEVKLGADDFPTDSKCISIRIKIRGYDLKIAVTKEPAWMREAP